MSNWGTAVARAIALRRPLPDFRHAPFAVTELHRAPAAVHDGVLSPALLAAARRQAEALALPEGTIWLGAGARARTPIEQAIRALEVVVRPPPGSYAGCEWWVQRLGAEGTPGRRSLPLHWDKDECEAAGGRRMTHPSLASVCYLSGAGGPTVVLPVRTADISDWREAERPEVRGAAFASMPVENRLLTFQGDLLHGVSEEPWPVLGERLTLLVNWWSRKPAAPCCEEQSNEAAAVAVAAAPMVPCHELTAAAVAPAVCDGVQRVVCPSDERLWLQLPGLLGGEKLPLPLPEGWGEPGSLVCWDPSLASPSRATSRH